MEESYSMKDRVFLGNGQEILDPMTTQNSFDTELLRTIEHKTLEEHTAVELIKTFIEQYLLPKPEHTAEELDKINSHLDSRSRQHYNSYNIGYLKAIDDIKSKLRGDK